MKQNNSGVMMKSMKQQDDVSKVTICRYFAKGQCSNGMSCRFMHSSSQQKISQIIKEDGLIKPQEKKSQIIKEVTVGLIKPRISREVVKVCRYFEKGNCSSGSSCRFSHGSSSHEKKIHTNRNHHSLTSFSCIKCGHKKKEEDDECCRGFHFKMVRGITVSKIPNMVNYMVSLNKSWKICTSSTIIPSSFQNLFTYTDACKQIELDVLKLLSQCSKDQVASLESWGYITRPWTFAAASLKSKSNVMDIFIDKAEFIAHSSVVDNASVGDVIDTLVDDACESGRLGPKWTKAVRVGGVLDPFNIQVNGTPDAFYEGSIPIELKTIKHLNKTIESNKLDGFLNQIAAYQFLYELNGYSDRAILLLISREDHMIKALEVSPRNQIRALVKWEAWIAESEILRECLDIARVYSEEIAVNGKHEPESFLDVCSQSYNLFASQSLKCLEQCHHYLELLDCDQIVRCYRNAIQCYKKVQSQHGVNKRVILEKILDCKKKVQLLAVKYLFQSLTGDGLNNWTLAQNLYSVIKSSEDKITALIRSCKKVLQSIIRTTLDQEFEEMSKIVSDMIVCELQGNMKRLKELELLEYQLIFKMASDYIAASI